MIGLNKFLISGKYNSDPAQNAIVARAKSVIKDNCLTLFADIKLSKYGPKRIPENKYPEIKGNFNLEKL
jgi:hypothetical protein